MSYPILRADIRPVTENILRSFARKFVCSYSGNPDLKFEFNASAATDGESVSFAPFPANPGDAVDEIAAVGAHEAHHVLFTDMGAIPAGCGSGFADLVNALEDIRVDTRGCGERPGVAAWRRDFALRLIGEERAALAEPDTPLATLLAVVLYWHLKAKFHGTALPEAEFARVKGHLAARLPADRIEKLLSMSEACVGMRATGDVVSLVRSLYRTMGCPDSFLHFLEKGGEYIARNKEKRLQKAAKRTNLSGCSALNASAAFPAEVSATGRDSGADFATNVRSRLDESGWSIERSPVPARVVDSFREQLLAGSAQRRLRSFFAAPADAACTVRQEGIRLNMKRLARAAANDRRVFEGRAESRKADAAVVVLLDRSGSMTKANMVNAKCCSYLLAKSFEAAKLARVSVLGFPGLKRKTLLEIKGFTDSARSAFSRFESVTAFGFTPIEKAIDLAGLSLLARPERKKFVFLLTDGLVGEGTGLSDQVAGWEAKGIRFLCLGIGARSPHVFTNQKNVAQPDEIFDAALELLAKERAVF
jgi:Mg-chelatase subunit ChlD